MGQQARDGAARMAELDRLIAREQLLKRQAQTQKKVRPPAMTAPRVKVCGCLDEVVAAQNRILAACNEAREPLTPREVSIVSLLASSGVQDKHIAYILGIGTRSVRIYVHHILRKLKLDSRTELALYGVMRGFVIGYALAAAAKTAEAS